MNDTRQSVSVFSRSGTRKAGWLLSLCTVALLLPGCMEAGGTHGQHSHDDSTANPAAPAESLSALAKYVFTPDSNFSWKLRETVKGADYTAHFLDMTSLSWRSKAEVDQTVWKHHLTIVVPSRVLPGPNILYIGGGSSTSMPPSTPSDTIVNLARLTGAVTIELRQVPNQPLVFSNHDGKPHTEDGIVAFSWKQAMKTGDPTWSARFPMVKSSVRAIDAAREFLYSPAGGSRSLDSFIVMGASKRGWTAWLTAAVDPRVVGVVPIVIDVLNTNAFMKQHIETYGFWAISLYDYFYNDITTHIGSDEMNTLLKNEDPYFFRDKLTMPKYMVNATNDQFFLPDGSQNYFADLKGEKYLRYVANADHSLRGSDYLEGIAAYVAALRRGSERPSFAWQFQGEDTIRVESKQPVSRALLWQATNPTRRDFRQEAIGKVWTSTVLTAGSDGSFVGKVIKPATGYTAFFIELEYAGDLAVPQKYTTQVRVLPDVRPFANIDPRLGKLEGT
ncbi:MAG: hypothetical protein JNJ46_11315 [Myxococcales bacterium]|nr:hypothetical protein [Myxococcales bacterium]